MSALPLLFVVILLTLVFNGVGDGDTGGYRKGPATCRT